MCLDDSRNDLIARVVVGIAKPKPDGGSRSILHKTISTEN